MQLQKTTSSSSKSNTSTADTLLPSSGRPVKIGPNRLGCYRIAVRTGLSFARFAKIMPFLISVRSSPVVFLLNLRKEIKMRLRPISIALAAAAFMAAGTLAAEAADGFARSSGVLRAGPGTDYPVVDDVSRGDDLEIFGCTSGYSWCDVEVDDSR
eukprot:gene38869-47147_t